MGRNCTKYNEKNTNNEKQNANIFTQLRNQSDVTQKIGVYDTQLIKENKVLSWTIKGNQDKSET